MITKVKDRVNITFPLSMVTYFIMYGTHFNVINLLIHYIERITIVWDLNFGRKPNMALGYLISYILKVKYNLSYTSAHDHTPSFFIDHSFNIFITREGALLKVLHKLGKMWNMFRGSSLIHPSNLRITLLVVLLALSQLLI